MIIISTRDDDGVMRASSAELAEQVREDTPDAKITVLKGPISGIQVDDVAAVRWLMRSYTAAGKPRKETR
jgi:hypothetical protein